MVSATRKRCAIYTRKSSEEGLEQDFNSLHAQREACEAFVKSQAGEGWRLIKTAYDDGGFSGGSIERPALQQLLSDIRARDVEVVVVYKVDRLTRSLADFARIVELFDEYGVSFVSITQQFNTTTSMGRLTLNVLLSFAQFEREVIGERIRDKIAASKRKGLWVGGGVPIGYDVQDHNLVINEAEAAIVRHIFQRYLQLDSVRRLKCDLDERAIRSAVKTSKAGKTRGGKPFSRGALYTLLSNRIYRGEIRHKREWHPGRHEPIVSASLWEKVQEKLRSPALSHNGKTTAAQNLLAGKVFDEHGQPLYVQGASRGQRRYRYYVSRQLVTGKASKEQGGWRLPARELDLAVRCAAQTMLGDSATVVQAIEESGCDSGSLIPSLDLVQSWIERLQKPTEATAALRTIVERVELAGDGIRVTLRVPMGGSSEHTKARLRHIILNKTIHMQLKRRGVELRMIIEGGNAHCRTDLPLLKAVARARRWAKTLIDGRMKSIRQLAQHERIDVRSLRRMMPLGFLSPRVMESIAEGRQSPHLTVIGLTRRVELPLLWEAQERRFGPMQRSL